MRCRRITCRPPCVAKVGTAFKRHMLQGTDTDAAAQEDQAIKNEEDEGKGVEMEGDFEGDMFDLPSDDEADNEEGEENADEEQRLDQEMGDVGQEGQVHFLTNLCWSLGLSMGIGQYLHLVET